MIYSCISYVQCIGFVDCALYVWPAKDEYVGTKRFSFLSFTDVV